MVVLAIPPQVLTVQVQLRQLLAKLAAPFRLGEQDRALLAAADAFYGVADLALSRRLTVRCDNTALLSALGELHRCVTVRCLPWHIVSRTRLEKQILNCALLVQTGRM